MTDAKQFSALQGPEQVGNLTVEQPGFTLGGPLIKNKLFWFVSAEFIRQSSFSPAGSRSTGGCSGYIRQYDPTRVRPKAVKAGGRQPTERAGRRPG